MTAHRGNDRSYWLQKLGGDTAACTFPGEPPAIAAAGARTVQKALRDALSERLSKVANGSDFRLFAILAAAAALLLRKYSGNNDVVLNTTITRQNSDGPFINTLLPLRLHVSSEDFGRDVILRMAQELREAIEHQNYPTRALELNRNSGNRQSLFRVFVLLEGFHDVRFLGHVEPDATLLFRRAGSALSLDLTYNGVKYSEEVVRRLADHLEAVLHALAFQVEAPVGRLHLAPAQTLIATDVSGGSELVSASIIEAFDEVVRRWPDRTAVVDEQETLTYRELSRRVETAACRLAKSKSVRDCIVGLAADRSIAMVVGILTILKAGGAYFPIDLSAPDERIRAMLAIGDVRTVLGTNGEEKDSIRPCATAGGYLGDPGRTWHSVSALCRDAAMDGHCLSPPRPSALAYLIFTSGSTGSPKGVLIEHHSVVNLAKAFGRAVLESGAEPTRVGLIAPYTFDGSIKQIFGALLNGHALYIVPEEGRVDPRALFKFLARHCVEVLDGTPTHLRQWIAMMKSAGPPPSVRRFVIGGEPLPRDLVSEVFAAYRSAPVSIVNVYGPTECCDVTTLHEVQPHDLRHAENIPIGRPLPGCIVEIYDLDGHPAPAGAVGEICIGGAGVGRGYLTAQELTPRGLTPDSAQAMAKYRTGDLGRIRSDGTLDFHGRIDRQIKFLGYRIDPREIEGALRRIDGIADAAVVAHQSSPDRTSLCAYYAPLNFVGHSEQGGRRTSGVLLKTAQDIDLGELGLNDLAATLAHDGQGTCVQAAEVGVAKDAFLGELAGVAHKVAWRLERMLEFPRDSGPDGSTLVLCKGRRARALAILAASRLGATVVLAEPDWPIDYLRFIRSAECCSVVLCDGAASSVAMAIAGDTDTAWMDVEVSDSNGNGSGPVDRSSNASYRLYAKPETGYSHEYLRDRLGRELPSYMIPTNFMVIDRLPMTTSGKLDLSRLNAPAPADTETYVAPANEVEEKIASVWATVLGIDSGRIGRYSSFFNLGGNSLMATLLLLEIQAAFSVEIPLGTLFEKPTLAEQAAYLGNHAAIGRPAHEANVIPIHRAASSQSTLFLVHDGLGHVEPYVPLRSSVRAPINLSAIRAEPRTCLSMFDVSIASLAAEYVDRILRLQPSGQYLVGGWSLGGVIAFEMARELEARGHNVAFVALMDVAAPLPTQPAQASTATERDWICCVLPELAEAELPANVEADRLWLAAIAALESRGAAPSDIFTRLLQGAGIERHGVSLPRTLVEAVSRVNLSRALIAAQRQYRPSNAIRCNLTYFGAQGSLGAFDARWDSLTMGRVQYHTVAGDHFSMLREPHVNDLAALLFQSATTSLGA